MDLNLTWFILVGVLLCGYAILDGFDLGVGALHLFAKGDNERRLMINSIGPVWDGNVVSKAARNDLIGFGLATRCCFMGEQGYTAATYKAFTVFEQGKGTPFPKRPGTPG